MSSLEAEIGYKIIATASDLPAAVANVHTISETYHVHGTITVTTGNSIEVKASGALIGRSSEIDSFTGSVAEGLVVVNGGHLEGLKVENTSADSAARSVFWKLTGAAGDRVTASDLHLVGSKAPKLRGHTTTGRPDFQLRDSFIESTTQMQIDDSFGDVLFLNVVSTTALSGVRAFAASAGTDAYSIRFLGCKIPVDTTASAVGIFKNASATVGEWNISACLFEPDTGTLGSTIISGIATTDANVTSSGNTGLADG